MRDRTGICIFEGIMDAPAYVEILQKTSLPFVHEVFPDERRFMQDNDPKHNSKVSKDFLAASSINWWRTPLESADLNPIENRHELKEYLRREVKPKTKEELIRGIELFWGSVSGEKCRKYIRHLHRVIPKVIELRGAATGY